jgi:hypothetical protein
MKMVKSRRSQMMSGLMNSLHTKGLNKNKQTAKTHESLINYDEVDSEEEI